MAKKLTILLNDLESLADFGSLNFIMALHFALIVVYDGLPSFSINITSICAKCFLMNWHLWGENFIKFDQCFEEMCHDFRMFFP